MKKKLTINMLMKIYKNFLKYDKNFATVGPISSDKNLRYF